MKIYYSQNREDLIIQSFFPDKTNGFYIDIGANDPTKDSVTKIFYDSGWSGINIEPIKKHFSQLLKYRIRDINLNIGISSKSGKLKLREYPDADGLSTFDSTMKEFYQNKTHKFTTDNYVEHEVIVKTLNQIIKENSVRSINFLKIDVEGYEYEVIKGYDWDLVRPELICIEANHVHKDWRSILERSKYINVFFDGLNEYYLSKESMHRLELFNYPEMAFANRPIHISTLLEVEEPLNKKIITLKKELQDEEEKVFIMQKQQRNVKFLATRLYQEIQARLNRKASANIDVKHSLIYGSSESIVEKNNHMTQDRLELLSFIHQQDRRNIKRRHKGGFAKRILNNIFWKAAAKTFRTGAIFSGKLARRIM